MDGGQRRDPRWVPVSPCRHTGASGSGCTSEMGYCLGHYTAWTTPRFIYKLCCAFWPDVMRQMHEGFEGQIQNQLITTQYK